MVLFSMRSTAAAIRKEQQTFPDEVDNRFAADCALGSDTLVELRAALDASCRSPTSEAQRMKLRAGGGGGRVEKTWGGPGG